MSVAEGSTRVPPRGGALRSRKGTGMRTASISRPQGILQIYCSGGGAGWRAVWTPRGKRMHSTLPLNQSPGMAADKAKERARQRKEQIHFTDVTVKAFECSDKYFKIK